MLEGILKSPDPNTPAANRVGSGQTMTPNYAPGSGRGGSGSGSGSGRGKPE